MIDETKRPLSGEYPTMAQVALMKKADEAMSKAHNLHADLIAAVKAVLRHEMETDQPFRQPYHGLMQALVNVTGSDDLGEK